MAFTVNIFVAIEISPTFQMVAIFAIADLPSVDMWSLLQARMLPREAIEISPTFQMVAIFAIADLPSVDMWSLLQARMLPREAENGVGMNRSARGGKCKAL